MRPYELFSRWGRHSRRLWYQVWAHRSPLHWPRLRLRLPRPARRILRTRWRLCPQFPASARALNHRRTGVWREFSYTIPTIIPYANVGKLVRQIVERP